MRARLRLNMFSAWPIYGVLEQCFSMARRGVVVLIRRTSNGTSVWLLPRPFLFGKLATRQLAQLFIRLIMVYGKQNGRNEFSYNVQYSFTAMSSRRVASVPTQRSFGVFIGFLYL